MISCTPLPAPASGASTSADIVAGGFSHDVRDAFYRSIAEDFRASQVIIFENEDLPSDLGTDANIIQFTGASHGRHGFIPKSV